MKVIPAIILLITTTLAFGQSVKIGDVRLSPRLLNYQGYLTDTLSNPINGSFATIFSIYDAPSGGNLKWSENQALNADKGIFHILLGAGTPIPDSVFTNSTNRYLQLNVAGQVLSPRTRIVSSAYAYTSTYSDTAAFARSSAADNKWSYLISDGSDTTLQMGGRWGLARQGNILYGIYDSTHVNLGVACTTGALGLNGRYSVVSGGWVNRSRGDFTTVGGGEQNIADDWCTTIAGGFGNSAFNDASTVNGGRSNLAIGHYAAVGGGRLNLAGDAASDSANVIAGGWENTLNGKYSFIGGGRYNNAANNYAVVGGGSADTAVGSYAVVAGGFHGVAGGYSSTVGGGYENTATNSYSTVCGGYQDTASGAYSVVSGGLQNNASGSYATVGGGRNNTASAIYSTAGGGYDNLASGNYSAISGGYNDTAFAYFSGVLSGYRNRAGTGTYDSAATVAGGRNNHANSKYSFVGGGCKNTANSYYATVAGGDSNWATYEHATVGGGYGNTASGYYATVSGGVINKALNYGATVAGGQNDSSIAFYSFTVGENSTVPSGDDNSAAFNGQTTTASGQTRVGILAKNSGTFTIDHPLDPENKILNHYFVESPEMVLIYRGSIVLDAGGRAAVDLPDYFSALNENPLIQLTGVGTSDVYIAEEVQENGFVVGGKPGAKVHWTVTGARKDPSAEITKILMPVEQPKDGGLAGRSLDDEFLVSTLAQLERMGKASGFKFRHASEENRYNEMKRMLENK